MNTSAAKKTNDSIGLWINAAKNNSSHIQKRKEYLTKSYRAIQRERMDSLLLKHLSALAYQNLKFEEFLLFKKQNKEVLAAATKFNDTFTIADAHWNYASYYNKLQVYDTAFYHFNLAHKLFDKKNYTYESAKTQYGMAFIKGRFKDYSGSEVLTFEALKKFNKTQNLNAILSCYNHLGQLQNDIKDYDRALLYYNKALGYLKHIKNNQLKTETIYNNIANTYVKQKKYIEALKYYNLILTNESLKAQQTNSYARVIDNKAYCKFLMNDTLELAKTFNKALAIRKRLNNKGGIVISKLHLAQYYAYKQDTSTAINTLQTAIDLAKEINNSRDYLKGLSIAAKLDPKNAAKYLKKHIVFTDSIQIIERQIQNKFTRIAYETEEYVEENKRLLHQKNWIITTVTVAQATKK